MYFLGLAEGSVQLVPDGTIFIHIALILLMLFILNKTLFKPINKILEERDKKTKGRSGEAGDILQSIDEKMAHYENSLREARGEGYILLEQTRSEAMSAREKKLNAIRKEVVALTSEQKDTINKQVEEAQATLIEEAQMLAARISSQILHRPVKG